ncbi:MAG: hypothetical protein HYR79_06035 [Nitrospirae bacterium]|nr:hypothetical protein [Nitrospirota bacterium]
MKHFFLLTGLFVLALAGNIWASEPSRISADLQKKIDTAENKDKKIPVIITFKAPVSSSRPLKGPTSRYEIITGKQREAEESQSAVLTFLKEKEKSGGVENIQSFWINNSLSVKAAPEVILLLGKRDDLQEIIFDGPVTLQAKKPAGKKVTAQNAPKKKTDKKKQAKTRPKEERKSP